jgi:DnaJ-class molecular chaperone
MKTPKVNDEVEMKFKEPKTEELNFAVKVKAAPPTICPYCHGMGYQETGEDTHECRICKGSGRNVTQ